jgi:hypothetical protein
MNDQHDNEATDKEMLGKLPWPVTEEQVLRHAREADERAHAVGQAGYPAWKGLRPRATVQADKEAKQPNPIHTDRDLQHIDIRLYFNLDADREATLDDISRMLQDSEMMCDLVSAYQLVNNGFGNLLPEDKPLA